MKKILIKIIIFIVAIISIIYIVYNFSIRKKKHRNIEEYKNNNEKTVATNIRIGAIEVDILNPLISKNNSVQNISRLIFEPLINLSSDYKLEQCLATEWIKMNHNVYIIKLRENVKWQDGEEFNSDDVIYTINAIKKEAENSIYYYNVKDIKKVYKLDEYTLKIVTNGEIPFFEYNLIFPIISSKSYSKNKTLSGTGIYYIEKNSKRTVVLKKNENWWKSTHLKLDSITITKYNSTDEALMDFEKNKVDLITSTLIDINEYVKQIQCRIKEFKGREYDYLALNCKDNVLKIKEVRQAISYAIDKDEIIKKVYNNKYKRSNFPLDFGNYLYSDNLERIDYNLEKAKAILKNINFKGNIKLKLLVNKENEDRIKVARVIKRQLKRIGIQIKIVIKNKEQYTKDIENRRYDLVLTGVTHGFSPSLNTYFNENNIANYKNKNIIKLIQEIENSEEQEKKEKLYQIIKYYNEDVPYISLYYDTNTLIYSNNLIGNIQPNSYNIFYNIENWHREYDKK